MNGPSEGGCLMMVSIYHELSQVGTADGERFMYMYAFTLP